ncbi:MAG: DUF4443 domain-containing protein [Promethearchaeota archaeon]
MFEELDDLFDSATIKPSFDYIHIILAIYLFGELKDQEGMGRYRLKEELLIGSGTVKSLITKLNKKINFISVVTNKNQKKGHKLTNKGQIFLKKIKNVVPILKEGNSLILKEILIEKEDMNSYFCLIKNAANKITDGIAQRDAAIKIDGSGATCLIYNGNQFIFPSIVSSDSDMDQIEINNNVQQYFKKELVDANLKSNDVIIIGLGDSPQKARLAALNAALTLI